MKAPDFKTASFDAPLQINNSDNPFNVRMEEALHNDTDQQKILNVDYGRRYILNKQPDEMFKPVIKSNGERVNKEGTARGSLFSWDAENEYGDQQV